VRHNQVKKLVLLSAVGALASLGLMILSILAPKPIYLVLAMSIGQGIGTLALALYLLAIVLDLQGGGAAYEASLEAAQESGGPDAEVPESKPSP
jgi:type III secretory pathway component EscT